MRIFTIKAVEIEDFCNDLELDMSAVWTALEDSRLSFGENDTTLVLAETFVSLIADSGYHLSTDPDVNITEEDLWNKIKDLNMDPDLMISLGC